MFQAGETPDAEALIRELAQRVPQHEDELMTLAQQLEQKGKREASLEIARNLLENGMDRTSVMKVTGLTEEDLKQIRH